MITVYSAALIIHTECNLDRNSLIVDPPTRDSLFGTAISDRYCHVFGAYAALYFGAAGILAALHTMKELLEVIVNGRDHFSSLWNVLDVLTYVGILASVCLSIWDDETPFTFTLRGWSALTAWLGTLNYLRAYSWSGPLVGMIVQIVRDMIPFVVVLIILMIGFVVGFEGVAPDTFSAVEKSSLSVFLLMLGDFDMDDFMYAGTPAITMFVLFMSLVVIVLMNLLIAIMGDSYDRVRENQFVASMRLRSDTLAEIDRYTRRGYFGVTFLVLLASLSTMIAATLQVIIAGDESLYFLFGIAGILFLWSFANFFQILMIAVSFRQKVIRVLAPHGKWEGRGGGDEWEGRLKAVRREIEKLKDEVASKEDVDKLKGEVNGNIDKLKADMKADTKAILDAVQK